ncbi:hypothetical protein LSAT2_021300 [Lamellibrachia satsuma]|nr:hypothetical protein LSAT2_021300 [Lamellibrachia satsuma]
MEFAWGGVVSLVPWEFTQDVDTFKATVQYSMLEKSAIVLIVAGVLLLVLAAIGVYGSYTDKVSVMNMVIIFGFVITVLTLACYVMARFYRQDVESKTEEYLLKSLRRYKGTVKLKSAPSNSCVVVPDVAKVVENLPWDYMMSKFQCCGATNYSDFDEYSESWQRTYTCYGETFNLTVPIPCCQFEELSLSLDNLVSSWESREFVHLKNCVKDFDPDFINTKSCATAMKGWLTDKAKLIEILSGVSGIIQIMWFINMIVYYTRWCDICTKKEPHHLPSRPSRPSRPSHPNMSPTKSATDPFASLSDMFK